MKEIDLKMPRNKLLIRVSAALYIIGIIPCSDPD
jgi:hypothetical protein